MSMEAFLQKQFDTNLAACSPKWLQRCEGV